MKLAPVLALALVCGHCAMGRAASEPFRIGVVGLTHGHAAGFFNALAQRSDVEITGVAEPDRTLFDRYADRYHLDKKLYFPSLAAMIGAKHPRAVVVYTSTFDHTGMVQECARAGVHVMMEKPLAVSYADAQKMAKAAEAGHIHVVVNYETTWYPANALVHKLFSDGTIGELRKVVVRDGHQGPKAIHVQPEFFAWLTNPKLNGAGALFDFGCYGADLMTWLMKGERPESVTAVTQQLQPDVYPRVDDDATIILKYRNANATLQPSWDWPMNIKDMAAYGSTGWVHTLVRDQVQIQRSGAKEAGTETAPPIPAPMDDSLRYFRAVVEGKISDENGLSSLKTNLVVSEILDAARRSAERREGIQLPIAP